MPTYSYRCKDCGKTFDVIKSIAEHGKKKPKCPKCGSSKVSWVPGQFFAQTGKKT